MTASGRVVEQVNATTPMPLSGVTVEVDDGLTVHQIPTKNDGTFSIHDLLLADLELVFRQAGFAERVERINPSKPVLGDIQLTRLDLPPALSLDDIYAGQAALIGQCETLRDRFALLDPPLIERDRGFDISELQSWRARFDTSFAALYYPWLSVRDPLQPDAPEGQLIPPSGHVAGLYAATDLAKGAHHPPANRALIWVDDLATNVDDALQGVLNPHGINAIRAFPGRGIRVYGARTLSSDRAWQFVNVRRLLIMLEEAIYDGLQWAVFEPNNRSLWAGLRLSLTTLLDGLWRKGALMGDSPEAAYQVRCDATTTTPDLQAEGKLVAEVRVAPTVPYEFIVLRLGVADNELKISEVSL
jgi:phage tail sheath protein FI